ncbi:hypothetical protein CLV92_113102 [Kineococcus xinjiangensis]|uniref:Sigma-70-like protein n=1 Tax=Kineococcus xinjiangensis TaxID=512762 RepID=A0A2S6IEP9_9ACTN|nr:hypothetical protein [Kineococcus xinjiangensis]PPK92673.1 hypothetical protein CLV92_113102 [Kineococcus xinjiangensis]
MVTVEELESTITLPAAVARYEVLRARDSLVEGADPLGERDGTPEPLDREEALELLALGEVIARKAGCGRQLAVRTARTTGATWAQIGQALGISRQSAWELHMRWIDQQVHQDAQHDYADLDAAGQALARALAGDPDDAQD